ncbi:MAG: 50S ribosomal protein L11 methyltransferase [Desulfobacterium sp.]|nr:50S ribosomal protein L11 methyltransferase [Desulfobacterium sp.]
MKWIHVKACFQSDDMELAEALVSEIFFNLGLKGVVCEVPLPEPDEGFGSNALAQPEDYSISGYFPDIDSSQSLVAALDKQASSLEGISVTITTQTVDDEDWAESWKDFFFVTRITDTMVIRPEWREFDPGPDDVVIDLDPGMAFGTGTHETTAMCLGLVEAYMKPGASFLDVGTGSGILMIAAGKLGAGRLEGLDNDEAAVIIARENIEKNGISPTEFKTACTTLDRYPDQKFDIVAANILAEVIIDILPDIKSRLVPGGIAILSGIINLWHDKVAAALDSNGFTVLKTETRGEWVAMAVTL